MRSSAPQPDSPRPLPGTPDRDVPVTAWDTPWWIRRRLRAVATAMPGRVAIVDANEEVTYAALLERVAALVARLDALDPHRGPVAVTGPRGAAHVVAMMALLSAGRCYVPLDPALSEARREHCLQRAGCHLLLDCGLEAVTRTGVAPSTRSPETDDALAYVMFTSGTTGGPKAVGVPQRALAHYAASLLSEWSLGPAHAPVFANVSPFSTDLGNTGIVLPLLSGGRVVVLDETTLRSPAAFWPALREHRVDHIKITPLHFEALSLGRDIDHKFERIVFGGDRLPVALARDVFARDGARVIVNHYGPTEATIGACYLSMTTDDGMTLGDGEIPIGRPFGDNTCTLIDPDGTPLQGAGTGELCIGGPGLAVGYLGDSRKTAERFGRRSPGGERLYRTGDRCRRDASGVYTFIGRVDRQVKIRGFRVEPQEVESTLLQHPKIGAAVVVPAGPDRSRFLGAVVQPRPGLPAEASLPDQIQRWVAQTLPKQLRPRTLIVLDAIPLNGANKPDRAAVTTLVEAATRRREVVPTHHDAELERLLAVAQRCLGLPTVCPDTSVFEQGADSLAVMMLAGAVRAIGLDIDAQDIYERPRLRELAQRGRSESLRPAPPIRRSPDRDRSYPLSAVQRWFFAQSFANPDHYNQAVTVEFARPVQVEPLRRALHALVHRHDALRTAYVSTSDGWRSRPPTAASTVSLESVRAESASPDETAVRSAIAAANASLSLRDGLLSRFVLVQADRAPDRLVCIVHHLAVDGVSWRILLDELESLYDEACGGTPLAPGRPTQHWEINEALATAVAAGAVKLPPAPSPCETTSAALPVDLDGGAETEGSSSTLSVTLDAASVRQLQVRADAQGVALHEWVLAAFVGSVGRWSNRRALCVDIEGHGRDAMETIPDASRTVGWFTSLARADVAWTEDADIARAVQAALSAARVAGGRFVATAGDAELDNPRPQLVFNYLGRFASAPGGVRSAIKLSGAYPGPTRSPDTDRIYKWKLAARQFDSELVLDLCFSRDSYRRDTAERLLASLVEQLGLPAQHVHCSEHSSAGLVTYRAPAPRLEVRAAAQPVALVTGAAGFLGAHLLKALLDRQQRVHCIVRADDDRGAAARLRERFSWYHPAAELSAFDALVTTAAGDLDRASFARLPEEIGSVFHAAADTRMLGDRRSLFETNVGATQRVLEFCRARPFRQLHHVSTASVAGRVDEGPTRFCERSLERGQSFLSYYEQSKYEAERCIRASLVDGGNAQIYRFDNLGPHGHTGRFQINPHDNWLAQQLRCYVLLGAAPRLPGVDLRITAVDDVANIIAHLALSAPSPGRTFHLDSWHSVSHDALVDMLREHYPVESVDADTFLASTADARPNEARDAVVAGSNWVRRSLGRNRNVEIDCRRSWRTVRALGLSFQTVDRSMVARLISHFSEVGFLPVPQHLPANRRPRSIHTQAR